MKQKSELDDALKGMAKANVANIDDMVNKNDKAAKPEDIKAKRAPKLTKV